MGRNKIVVNATRVILLAIVFFGTISCYGQEESEESEESEGEFKKHHVLSLVLSHAHVFEGRDAEGKRSALSLPAWGIDYNYVFHPRWAIGLHTDIIVEKFKVEKALGNKEVIERTFPIAPAVMGVYKASRHWSFLLGMGAEFAKEENFVLTRAGVEYGAEISKGWEVFGTFGYDFRWEAYDTWAIGIGIAKAFGE